MKDLTLFDLVMKYASAFWSASKYSWKPFYSVRYFDIFFFLSCNSDFSISRKCIFFFTILSRCILTRAIVVYFNCIGKYTGCDFSSLIYKFLTVFWCMHLLHTLILLKSMQTDTNTHIQMRISPLPHTYTPREKFAT